MTERDLRWNRFIDEICGRELHTLNRIQRKAVISFWYDAEMNSGGYSSYADSSRKANSLVLYAALRETGGRDIAKNYLMALTTGRLNAWEETDDEFYGFQPNLTERLEQYVEAHKDDVFS